MVIGDGRSYPGSHVIKYTMPFDQIGYMLSEIAFTSNILQQTISLLIIFHFENKRLVLNLLFIDFFAF